jgi:hypothetical protein
MSGGYPPRTAAAKALRQGLSGSYAESGGLAFEDNRPDTLAEAMAALEKGLRKWFDEQGIDLDKGERP